MFFSVCNNRHLKGSAAALVPSQLNPILVLQGRKTPRWLCGKPEELNAEEQANSVCVTR